MILLKDQICQQSNYERRFFIYGKTNNTFFGSNSKCHETLLKITQSLEQFITEHIILKDIYFTNTIKNSFCLFLHSFHLCFHRMLNGKVPAKLHSDAKFSITVLHGVALSNGVLRFFRI